MDIPRPQVACWLCAAACWLVGLPSCTLHTTFVLKGCDLPRPSNEFGSLLVCLVNPTVLPAFGYSKAFFPLCAQAGPIVGNHACAHAGHSLPVCQTTAQMLVELLAVTIAHCTTAVSIPSQRISMTGLLTSCQLCPSFASANY